MCGRRAYTPAGREYKCPSVNVKLKCLAPAQSCRCVIRNDGAGALRGVRCVRVSLLSVAAGEPKSPCSPECRGSTIASSNCKLCAASSHDGTPMRAQIPPLGPGGSLGRPKQQEGHGPAPTGDRRESPLYPATAVPFRRVLVQPELAPVPPQVRSCTVAVLPKVCSGEAEVTTADRIIIVHAMVTGAAGRLQLLTIGLGEGIVGAIRVGAVPAGCIRGPPCNSSHF